MSNITEGTVTATISEQITENNSCSTSQLSSLFASFLTGGSVTEMQFQKYFVLYRGSPSTLLSRYEKAEGNLSDSPVIDRVDVRISSTSRDDNGNYYATFIGTFQKRGLVKLESNFADGLSLALVAGDKILAFTSFDESVYRKLCDGSRAEIKWQLQLRHM